MYNSYHRRPYLSSNIRYYFTKYGLHNPYSNLNPSLAPKASLKQSCISSLEKAITLIKK